MTNNTDNFNAYLIKIIHNNIYQHIAQRQQLKFLNFTQRKSVVQYLSLTAANPSRVSILSERREHTEHHKFILALVTNT